MLGGGPEPYEDDLQTFSDNQAWEDSRADMAEMGSEDGDSGDGGDY